MGSSQSSHPSFQPTDDGAKPSDDSKCSQPNSKRKDLGFLELAAGINPEVDIVAIHGLDGHREKAWTAENGTLWLRDLLPADLPNARVLSYGYDADTCSRECVSTQTIYRHADKFVKELSRKRKDAPRRPIIFVAHSLGGIILKQALVICHAQILEPKSPLRDIVVSTHGVMFFGTPHSGTNGVALLQMVNRLLSVYTKTTKVIVQHLKANSSELENIQSMYSSASEELNTVCFYEEYSTPIVSGRQEMIVPRHSATLAGAVEEALHADHCQMVKFSNRGQSDYETVLSYLSDWMKGAASAVTEKWVVEDVRRDAKKGEPPPVPGINVSRSLPPVSRSYIERREIQSSMTQKLLPGGRKRHQPRCILHGIGGAGKTQLATNWIKEHEECFKRIIVVDASNKRRLEGDLQRAIRVVGPEYINSTWEDAVAYLDDKERGWMLFFDNADSPDLDLGPYLPSSTHGAILITTRNQEWRKYAPDSEIHVGGLSESEAIDLLHNIADVTPTSNHVSLEIVRELGMLALAVTQAGAYIFKTRRLSSYLDTLRRNRNRLLRDSPLNSTNYPHSTYAAFDMSFHQLSIKVQKLLRICANYHHSGIPMALFERSTASGFMPRTILKRCPPPKSDKAVISNLNEMLGSTWDEVSFQDMIDAAQRASFISTFTDDAGSVFYSIHPLLQSYIKDSIGDTEGHYTRMAAQLLLGATQRSEENNSWYWQLVSHIDALPQSAKAENITHAMAFHQIYDSLGVWKESKRLLESALSKSQDIHGRLHEQSICIIGRIAQATFDSNQLEDAEKLEREVLCMRIELLGRHHPGTVSAMGNLARTLRAWGRLEEAEKLTREVLGMRIELYGRHHPGTVSATGNLARTLRARGQLEEAEKLQREALGIRIKLHGRRGPGTVRAMGHLAQTLHALGQLEEAEKLTREVLDMRIELLGRRHPRTIRALGRLAVILNARGQPEEAEKLHREVLDMHIKLHGRRHPDTARAMSSLARTLHARRQLEEAEKLAREAVKLAFGMLGKDHPDVIFYQSILDAIIARRVSI